MGGGGGGSLQYTNPETVFGHEHAKHEVGEPLLYPDPEPVCGQANAIHHPFESQMAPVLVSVPAMLHNCN